MSLYSNFRKSLALLFLAVSISAGAATWVDTESVAGTGTQLRSIWSANANNTWAVGGGTSTPEIAYWNGSTWALQSSPVAKGLNSVWGLNATSVWAGGRDGAMLFYNGSSWVSQSSSLELPANSGWLIYDIWGIDANNVWAVAGGSGGGRVLKWNGSAWSAIHSSAAGLRSLWVGSANNIWAVGDNGFVTHFDGSTWTSHTAPTGTNTLLGVWGADANNVWIVGGRVAGDPNAGALLKWDGSTLDHFSTTGLSLSAVVLRGVTGSSANNLYVVGDSGVISRWNGSTWASETSSTVNLLTNIWSNAAATELWVSGGTGTVVRGTAVATSVAPTVTTPTSTAVTHNTATLGGTISATGGADATARGVVYALTSQNANPEIGGANVTVLTESGTFSTGAFTRSATSLAASSAYSYKAYATNSAGTSYSSVGTFSTPAAPAPEIAVSYNGNNVADGLSVPTTLTGTDFGSTPVAGGQVEQTFTIANSGTAILTVNSVSTTGDFSVVTQPANNVAIAGSTTFTIRFDPTATGVRTGTVSFTNNDGDESPFNFNIQGTGTGPQTFDLAGTAITNTPFNSGETYIYSAVQPPVPVPTSLGDVVSSGPAPGADGSTNIGDFGLLRRGGFMAENGYLVFPGNLEIGTGSPAVTTATSSGLWKTAGGNLFLLARSGTTVPEVAGAQFSTLPEVPGINDGGEVSFLGTLVIGTGGVTVDDDTGLWSELGGSGLGLLMRENDAVPGLTNVRVAKFASGIYATAKTGANTGEAAFSVTYKGDSTKSAILRASVGAVSTTISVVATEGATAPGTTAVFANIAGSYSDPGRMDAAGNLVFTGITTPGNKDGIWYQPVAGTAAKVFSGGDTAPNTGGATFLKLYYPSMGSGGVISFRASLNKDGDNTANTRNDGIWRGNAATPAGITCILRRGDDNTVVSNLPAGSRVGNPWGGWLTNTNRGAWRAWLDVNGDFTSAAPTDVNALYTDLSGTMLLALKAGDAAPGTTGATFSGFDLPVVGGSNQYAFLGTLTGGDTVTANNQGLWKSAPNGGALTLVLRKGDVIQTSEGPRTVDKIDLPGSNSTDRRWEQSVMDSPGRMVVYITFTNGSSSQIIVP